MKYFFTAVVAFAIHITSAWAGDLQVQDAWVRHAPPVIKQHAGYFTLHNTGTKPRSLISVSSKSYQHAMLHASKTENGIATMQHLAQVTIPAGGKVMFAPGGLHVMLMQPVSPLQVGDHVPLVLTFANGETLPVMAMVKKDNGGMGHHMHHKHHKSGS